MIFIQIVGSLSPLCLHIGTPSQHLLTNPSLYLKWKFPEALWWKRKKITSYDDSWIDSVDSRPIKGRKEITRIEKIEFAKKLRKIDPCSGILVFFFRFPQTMMKMKIFLHILIIIYLTWPYYGQAKNYVKTDLISYQRTTFQILLMNF